ncbi:MAG: ABC transporter ATP-binding protein [Rhodobacterales bacterium]
MTLLSVEKLEVQYGASQALFGVSFTVDEGEVVALMGRNGMGKTTTIHAINRMVPAMGGSITFDGHDLLRLPSFRAARLGLGLVPEGRRCFAPLTVHENLIASARPGHWDFKRIRDLFPRLGERRDQKAASLSGGEQQMLAIARALMTNPRLLLLDEATEGLAPVVRQEIWAAIAVLKRESGLAIVVVDKALKELNKIADRAVIIERGQSVWTGQPSGLTADLADRYLGV